MHRFFLVSVLLTVVLVPLLSTATDITLPNPLCTDQNGNTIPGCQNQTIPGLVTSILNWLKDIGAIIAGGMIVYGAFQILFAGGDPERFSTGRKTILYAVIGYVIIWIGSGLTSIIAKVLTTSP